MFGMGIFEIGVIFVVALIALGPEKLPGFARGLGKIVNDLRRVATEFQRSLNTADVPVRPIQKAKENPQKVAPQIQASSEAQAQGQESEKESTEKESI